MHPGALNVDRKAFAAAMERLLGTVRRALKRNIELDELLYQTVLEQKARALSTRVLELESLVLTTKPRASKAEELGSALQTNLLTPTTSFNNAL